VVRSARQIVDNKDSKALANLWMQADAWVVYITRDGQNHIDNACTVILAENSLNIWSNTVYIYGSGQPYVMKCAC